MKRAPKNLTPKPAKRPVIRTPTPRHPATGKFINPSRPIGITIPPPLGATLNP